MFNKFYLILLSAFYFTKLHFVLFEYDTTTTALLMLSAMTSAIALLAGVAPIKSLISLLSDENDMSK